MIFKVLLLLVDLCKSLIKQVSAPANEDGRAQEVNDSTDGAGDEDIDGEQEDEQFDEDSPEEFNSEQALTDVLSIISMICIFVDDIGPQQKAALDEHTFMSDLIKFCIWRCDMAEDSEIASSTISCLFGISTQFTVASENPVVCGLYIDNEAAQLGQYFIHVVNRSSSLVNTGLLAAALNLFRMLFEFSLSSLNAEECFFFTNDIRVILDIIVRELLDMDENSLLRHVFLQLLYSIVRHPDYAIHGNYQSDEIGEIVRAIAKNEDDFYDTMSVMLAREIATRCK